MDYDEILAFWKKSSHLDKKTSEALLKSKNFVGCLFFVHLYLEKILKGLVQKKTNNTPPFTHDLLVLTKLADISDLTPEQRDNLSIINTFNIRARYADYKFSFYKTANRNFTVKYCRIAEELYKWFLKLY